MCKIMHRDGVCFFVSNRSGGDLQAELAAQSTSEAISAAASGDAEAAQSSSLSLESTSDPFKSVSRVCAVQSDKALVTITSEMSFEKNTSNARITRTNKMSGTSTETRLWSKTGGTVACSSDNTHASIDWSAADLSGISLVAHVERSREHVMTQTNLKKNTTISRTRSFSIVGNRTVSFVSASPSTDGSEITRTKNVSGAVTNTFKFIDKNGQTQSRTLTAATLGNAMEIKVIRNASTKALVSREIVSGVRLNTAADGSKVEASFINFLMTGEGESCALALVPPSRFTDARTWLGEFYEAIKSEVDKYSYVQVAVDLGFSATNGIFLMIRGHRRISLETAKIIAEALELNGREEEYLLLMSEYENTKLTHERERIFTELVKLKGRCELSRVDRAQLRFFTEWYHSVIRELVGLPCFSEDSYWICEQLNPHIRPRQASESLSLLVELRLIRKDDATNKYIQCDQYITTGDEVSSLAIVRFHQQMIDLGKESITNLSEDDRDVSAIQVAANSELMAKIKDEVRNFRKHLIEMCAGAKESDRILQLNMQIFPVADMRKK